MTRPPAARRFFKLLKWLDGRPLLPLIEPYRMALFEAALDAFGPDGRPAHDLVLAGRAKKNWKSADLVLAALVRFLAWPPAPQGNDVFLVASDEDQAADDLSLATKLIRVNEVLGHEVLIRDRWIERRDGRGTLRVLPARDVAGLHGKTYAMAGFDEVHTYRTWDVLEALAPDPTRPDALTWITSYASLYTREGAPLNDLFRRGVAGADARMLFSWYSGDFTTDPTLADAPTPEARANPSAASWDNPLYLEQQRRRLPWTRFRRLHLNLPGAPEGAFLQPDVIAAAVVSGRRKVPREDGARYVGFVDMSGGSNDDAVVCVGHRSAEGRAVIDAIEKQAGAPPFNPRAAVKKFVALLRAYGVSRVVGDAYAGETFRSDFEGEGIAYSLSPKSTSDLYEDFEPRLNAGEVELLDVPKLTEQLTGLVTRGGKVTHLTNEHDDFATAAAGVVMLLAPVAEPLSVACESDAPLLARYDRPSAAECGVFGPRARPARLFGRDPGGV